MLQIKPLFKKKNSTDKVGRYYLALYMKDHVELISTGQTIKETDWKNWSNRSKNTGRPTDDAGTVSQALRKIEGKIGDAITRLNAKKEIITPLKVKQEYATHESEILNSQLQKDKDFRSNNKTLKHLAEAWIQNQLFMYAPLTQKAVKESIKQFIEFLTKYNYSVYTKTELSNKLVSEYERYLQDVKKFGNGTHGQRIKHLRWFLKSVGHDVRDIKIRKHQKTIISLELSELRAIESYEIENNDERQRAKDLFLLGCYTGQRIKELKRITASHISNKMLRITQQKTKKEVTVPLAPIALTILEKYGMKSPKISEQAVNREIKEICKNCGITQPIAIAKSKAGKHFEESVPKYKLITTHVSSKTFISLATQLYDLTPAEVAAIVGKSLKTLLSHYYNLPKEDAIRKMQEKWIQSV